MAGAGDVTEGELRGGRLTVAVRPQHLLLTLLGDYWYPRFDGLPSGALVDLLGEFGVSEANARAALSRVARRGLLESRRQGRRTIYALTDDGMSTLVDGTRRIFTFGAGERAWDHRWTVVAFSIPEDSRSIRSALRTRLGWLGFAALYDAVWVAPGNREVGAAGLLEELGVTAATVVVGEASRFVPGGDPVRAWDLDELGARYREFLAEFEPLRDRAGSLSDAEALVARTSMIDVWRTFPGVDPELPSELLPPGWPQPWARALFTQVYDELGPAAIRRVRAVLTAHDPTLATLAAHHTSANALHLEPAPVR